jgi:SAM-dependent methyltransferase
MAQRQDKNLVLGDSVELCKRRELNGTLYRGFSLSTSAQPAITIKNVLKWYPFSDRTLATGWAIRANILQAISNSNTRLEVCLRDDAGNIVAANEVEVASTPTPIFLPKQLPSETLDESYHLTLQLKSYRKNIFPFGAKAVEPGSVKPAHAFLQVHEALHREEILKQCQGKGIEIGPGHRPQVMPSSGVDVTYIEQSAPQDWERLYNDAGNYVVNPELWSRYQIGEACDLPIEDSSLDFIFSSHVFEHLANPLGHLQHWHSKLRENGKVLGIVPDISGCKDYVYRPSPLSELLAEQASGDMEPTLAHYARWAKYRRPGSDPEEFYKAKRSIHVHYYTRWNMTEVLQYAVENLGYAWFNVRHVPNHKDFYFVLSR